MIKQIFIAAVFGLMISFTKQPSPAEPSHVNKIDCKHFKNKTCNLSRLPL